LARDVYCREKRPVSGSLSIVPSPWRGIANYKQKLRTRQLSAYNIKVLPPFSYLGGKKRFWGDCMDDLSEIPLFSSLPSEKSRQVARRCSWREYGEHELVIDIDDDSTDVRFVISGSVRIIVRIAVGKEVILGEMQEGSFFGEISAIDGEPRSANVTTMTKSRICTMPDTVFREILQEHPQVAMKIMLMFAQRVRSLNTRLAEHSFLQAKHRLYSELLRLSRPRSGHPAHRIVSPPPTQKELAERIGTRREVVSRELNLLEREGHVEKARGGIVIANVPELQRRISLGWEGA
jgi:CRP-like cAMP-binding protein